MLILGLYLGLTLLQLKYSMFLPETNLFFARDNRYPGRPPNSKSTPDNVVPSQLNCAAIVPCDPGPFVS